MTDSLRNEQMLAYKVRHALDHGTENLSSTARDRLRMARLDALAHQKAIAMPLSLAGAGGFTSEILLPKARRMAAVLALTLGVVGTYYWNAFQQAEDNEEIDSALLADDLPIGAYTDHGFHAWLEEPSHNSQSPEE